MSQPGAYGDGGLPDPVSEPGVQSGDWYCDQCQAFVSAQSVTFEQTHVVCGQPVYWQVNKVSEPGAARREYERFVPSCPNCGVPKPLADAALAEAEAERLALVTAIRNWVVAVGRSETNRSDVEIQRAAEALATIAMGGVSWAAS